MIDNASGLGDPPPNLPSPTSPTSSASDNTTIGSEENDNYHMERHGRYIQSGDAPYFLPIATDTAESFRLEMLHEVLYSILHSHTFGPFEEYIESAPGRKRILDLGSGNGIWVEAMATDWPHVKVVGLDLVPGPPGRRPNVRFEVYNFMDQLGIRYSPLHFNVVHARLISLGLSDYDRLAQESFRVLRPGGLFLSGEFDLLPRPGSPPADMPSTRTLLYRMVQCAKEAECENACDIRTISRSLSAAGFEGLEVETKDIKIGTWGTASTNAQDVGAMAQEAMLAFFDSLRPAMLDLPDADIQEVDELLRSAKDEVASQEQWEVTYQMVWARKP